MLKVAVFDITSAEQIFEEQKTVVKCEQIRGGGVKGCTYVLTLGIAHNPPNSKDVPHSVTPKVFTRVGLAR